MSAIGHLELDGSERIERLPILDRRVAEHEDAGAMIGLAGMVPDCRSQPRHAIASRRSSKA